jgi:DNA mismatch repair protein MutS2
MFDLKRLEFHKVLHILEGYCISTYSKEQILRAHPLVQKSLIERGFSLLEDLKRALDEGYTFTQPKFGDLRQSLERASVVRGRLDPEEFVVIRDNLRAAWNLKRQCEQSKGVSALLPEEFGSVRVPQELQKRIDLTIDERGRVRDDASARLEEIEKDLKKTRSRIESLLELYLNDPETRNYFQERHITLKDDRYVVPLKQNFKGRIPGVVHAHSSSEKTVFVEPFSVVDSNNELRRLEKEREKEIHRILVELTCSVRSASNELMAVQEVLSAFDQLMAKDRFRESYSCTVPEIGDETRIDLQEGRHPLISGEVVPIDFSLGDPTFGVVITGPNTGGKTVSLKTIGLSVLLAQSGIPVPAKSMKCCIFSSLFADIGDESSIEQSLSTFSSHIRNIKQITQKADGRSLILIDELGAGTDPLEGGALGTAILDFLMHRRIMTVVTTHFSFIKSYAIREERTEVASVEFDADTCRPTYRLVMGIPGRSNALEVAQNLGLDHEILDRSREYLGDEAGTMDGIFKNLARMEQDLNRREEEMAKAQAELDSAVREYRAGLDDLRQRREKIGSDFQQEFGRMMAEYRRRLEYSIKQVREEGAKRSARESARGEMEKAKADFDQLLERAMETGEPLARESESGDVEEIEPSGELEVGDRVTVSTAQGGTVEGRVIGFTDDKVTITAGSLRLTADRERVKKAMRPKERWRGSWNFSATRQRRKIHECDIRGMRFEEAMEEVSRFLDNAVLNNLGSVSIIHGMGTGALRQGVQDMLRQRGDIDHFQYARPEMGGFGCTIVTFETSGGS